MSRSQIPGGANGLQFRSHTTASCEEAGCRGGGRWAAPARIDGPGGGHRIPSFLSSQERRGSSYRLKDDGRPRLESTQPALPRRSWDGRNELSCARSRQPRSTTHARASEQALRAAMAPELRRLSLLGEYWAAAVDLVRVRGLGSVGKWVGGRGEEGTAGRGWGRRRRTWPARRRRFRVWGRIEEWGLDPGENFRTRDVQRTCVGPRVLRVGLQPADQNS
jgi:hypothetical protein